MQPPAKEATATGLKENCCSVDTRGGGGGRRDLQINTSVWEKSDLDLPGLSRPRYCSPK